MKVILLRDIAKLGSRYDIKDVASGHALNLLIPRGDAVAATRDAKKRIETLKAKIEGERKIHEDLIAKNISDLDGVTLRISGKANDKGSLFAGIHKDAIVAELLKQTKLQVDSSFIQMEHPIKEVGESRIEVKAAGKSAKIKLVVEAE